MKLTNNLTQPLNSFWDRFKSKHLHLPPHQRGDVWALGKKKKWWSDIEKNAKKESARACIPGCIITYTIGKNDDLVFINDGANRVIHSIREYISECENKGKDPYVSLSKCFITEQTVEYENVEEATSHFIDINSGSTSTPHEVFRCHFVSLPDYTEMWEPILESIYDTVNDALKITNHTCRSGRSRDKEHKHKRDSLAMFYRFASCDVSRWSPHVGVNTVNPDTNKRDCETERRCKELFEAKGVVEIRAILEKFKNCLEKFCALYRQLWIETGLSPLRGPTSTHIRWWLTTAIYHHNNGFNFHNFRTFTKTLIEETGGGGAFYYEDDSGTKRNTSAKLSCLSILSVVLRSLKLTLDFFEAKETRRYSPPLPPGFHNSHVNSFSRNGNGQTVPENALDNLSRGGKNMTEAEVATLSAVNQTA